MGPSTTFNRLPSTIPKSEKSKPLVDGLPIFRKCCYGRPLRAKRSRWAAFVAQHQTGHFGTEIFDHICQPIARAAKKARPKLATQAFSRFAKAGKQSVFHRNLGGDVGRHRFPSPRTLMKTALAPNRAKAVKDILWSGRREVQGFASQTLVSLRAIGPCVLRWKMLTHFLSFAPCRVRFPSPGTFMETALAPNRAKAVKTILWSGRRESNPRHQLGRLGFYH